MEARVTHAPVFSTLELSLSQGEYVVAQPNSMLTMSGGVSITAHVGRQDHVGEGAAVPTDKASEDGQSGAIRKRNSWWSGFKSLLGGESFFTAEFRAKSDDQIVVLAPESYGDIVTLDLQPEAGYYLTRGSYLANTGATDLQVKYGGLKGLMSKKGLFLMHATGSGNVFCQSFGSVIHRELADGENLLVDNRFMIAFSDSVSYKLIKATDSLKDSLMSGEGLVNRYTGPGHVYFQTRGKPTGGFLSTLIDVAV